MAKKTRITIDGKITEDQQKRFDEIKEMSGQKTKLGTLVWMLENLKVLK